MKHFIPLQLADDLHLRTYIPEPTSPHTRRWTDKPAAYQRVVYNNRRRLKTEKNRRLQRLRSEKVERSFAHVCQTGGARRTWLRGLEKVRKRYLMSAVARNLGLVMRAVFGIGTARSLQAEGGLSLLWQTPWLTANRLWAFQIANFKRLLRQPIVSDQPTADFALAI